MGIKPICAVQVGTHTNPYWIDARTQTIMCNRHKLQYEERPNLGLYLWEEISVVDILQGGDV